MLCLLKYMRYYIDYLRILDDSIRVIGWVVPKDPTCIADFLVTDKNGNQIDYKLARVERIDLAQIYLKDKTVDNNNFGFEITFPVKDNENYNLYIKTKEKTIKEVLSKQIVNDFNEKGDSRKNLAFRRKQYLINLLQIESIKRGFNILKKHGLKAYIRKLILKLKGLNSTYDYNEWYKKTKPTNEELLRQKNEYKKEFKSLPKFSIVIPIYNTHRDLLIKLFNSIQKQSYDNYEVVVCDATDYTNANNNPKEYFESLIKKNIDFSHKIQYVQIENKSISENTNKAVDLATGDYIILCDHDDELTLDCLYELTKEINDNPCVNFIYSDEDKIDIKSSSYFEPHFKSDFNLDMLTSVNYICHVACIKKEIVDELIKKYGCFERKEYNGAQDYDLFLRIVNILIQQDKIHTIRHIPKILYHWRSYEGSTSYKTSQKKYAIESGKKCLIDYYDNIDGRYSFKVKVVYYKDKFNYSKINNFGLNYCDGEYILFMNNDIEMINADSLKEMLDYVVRDDVGAVGAKLLYDDKTIQHAGVIIGIGGIASHAFKNVFDLQSSYMNRAQITQDLNAVTAAVLLTKKSILKTIKGFDEDFTVAFNDIDLCLRIRDLNKLIVYNPYATFYHYESKTRGYEDTKEKVDRFNTEVARFVKRWKDSIDKGDQYYNQNLTLMKEDFSLRDLDQEEIGKPYVMDKEIYRIMETL